MNGALTEPVDAFVRTLTPVLVGLAHGTASPQQLAGDVAVEAYDLTCAFIDADGRHSEEELGALIAAFAPRFETQLHRATPADVRTAGLVAGKRAWLDTPSLLFRTLLDADRRRATSHAWDYYDHAMRLAHVVASLDAVPTHAELGALDRFRGLLLGELRRAGVPRRDGGAPAPDVSADAVTVDGRSEVAPPRPLEELLAGLDALVGLAAVKAEVRLLTNLLQVQSLRRERGLKVVESSHHLIFTGNPGTGKTTVARLLASIYRTLGVVPRGHLVETDRSQLVAGFVGQTALRVREVFDRADGGLLLIDEAYALARGSEQDFGREAIDTIVKLVEDRFDTTVVIVAGYPDEMATFVDANPGLRSRFPRTIHFPDYTDDELVAIVDHLADRAQYRLDDAAHAAVQGFFARQERGRGFGNGRLARNLFERMIANQASRLVTLERPTDRDLLTLRGADVPD
ncbi:MAG TPA: AAA family ATPase [Nitriliruptorales bacterium]|nr:AAA family ATPase [Nitriliruptorales bacterium]